MGAAAVSGSGRGKWERPWPSRSGRHGPNRTVLYVLAQDMVDRSKYPKCLNIVFGLALLLYLLFGVLAFSFFGDYTSTRDLTPWQSTYQHTNAE